MTTPRSWRRYLTFWRANIAADVDDELAFHTDMRIADLMRRGMSEDDARRAVTARLGDVAAAKAECVELGQVRATHARRASLIDEVRSDVQFALRSLGRAPMWTVVALVTIALGVGATAAVFSVADALLVRTIPYPHASRVYVVQRQFTINDRHASAPIPLGAVREWRVNARTIEAAAPYAMTSSRFGSGSESIPIYGAAIDTAFLPFTGTRPLLGRNFTADELAEGGPAAIMLAEMFWRRQFGGARDVIGKVVTIGDRPRTVVGVVPSSASIPEFSTEPAEFFAPLVSAPNRMVGSMFVRLAPNVSPAAAIDELDAIYVRAKFSTASFAPGIVIRLALRRPQDGLKFKRALTMITGAVALLLLVACTNVAHLLLARGASRQRELALRHALGAGRARLLRQLVTESVVLATLGGVLGFAVGWAGLRLLAMLRPPELYALAHVSTDRRVVTIAAVLAIACGLAIGLLAALRSAHRHLAASLRDSATNTSRRSGRLRASLVVGEIAFSATLLVGALLLVHAVYNLQRTQLGFDAEGLYGVAFSLPMSATTADRAAFVANLRERAATMPGVTAVTSAADVPSPKYWRMLAVLETPERPATAENPKSFATSQVDPDYFQMLRMPIRAGRTFDDGSVARNEVVINTTLARQLWPDGAAIGQRLRTAQDRPGAAPEDWKTVIGVVPDVVLDLIGGNVLPAIYQPSATLKGGKVGLIVRMDGRDAATTLKQFATTMQPNNPNVAIINVRETIAQSMAEPRFTMRILVTFAALGVALSAIGLFGVISYGVSQRTREIGVRMALGATRRAIARLVVTDAVRLALLGVVIGLGGAVVMTRVLETLLFGLSRFDPFSFAAGAGLLLIVSVVACVAPMLRATAIDPASAIRVE